MLRRSCSGCHNLGPLKAEHSSTARIALTNNCCTVYSRHDEHPPPYSSAGTPEQVDCSVPAPTALLCHTHTQLETTQHSAQLSCRTSPLLWILTFAIKVKIRRTGRGSSIDADGCVTSRGSKAIDSDLRASHAPSLLSADKAAQDASVTHCTFMTCTHAAGQPTACCCRRDRPCVLCSIAPSYFPWA
jgi:hypothetical protein